MLQDMTTGKPLKLIWRFAVPVLIGNLFQQLYNMVDAVIVGQYLGIDALAALGITGSMNFLVLGFIIGMTSGFGIIMSQKFGSQDLDGLKKSVATSIILSIFLIIIITVLSLLTMRSLLSIINTQPSVMNYAVSYIAVIYAGTFSQVFFNLLAAILRSLGDSKTPLYFLIITSLLNVVLDLFFILNLNMGVAGAAVATVISQTISAVLCLLYMKKKYPLLKLKREDFKISLKYAFDHIKLGLPMALQFSITAIGIIILQGAVNKFGAEVVAGYTAASKVEIFLNQFMVSIGTAMATFAGQNFGAGRIDRIKKGVKKSILLAIFFAIISGAIITLFYKEILVIFGASNNQIVVDSARQYVFIMAPFFIFLGILFILRNTLQGIGKPLIPMLAGGMELIMRVASALILAKVIGFAGVCMGEPIAWIGATGLLFISYKVIIRKLKVES